MPLPPPSKTRGDAGWLSAEDVAHTASTLPMNAAMQLLLTAPVAAASHVIPAGHASWQLVSGSAVYSSLPPHMNALGNVVSSRGPQSSQSVPSSQKLC